jgi:hypothetical protein
MQLSYVTIPQSGTHILQRAFGNKTAIPAGPGLPDARLLGDVLHSHANYSELAEKTLRAGNRKIIFQYRDPRDIIVSRSHKLVPDRKAWRRANEWEEIIRWAGKWVVRMEPWMRHADIVLRYEDFILRSPKQMATLTDLLGEEFVSRIRIGGPSPTFRAGRIGDWKTDFPKEYRELYEKICEPIRYWEWPPESSS